MRQRENIRFFTVDEANRALPLVRRIMADIVEENERLQELLPVLKEARLRARRYGPDEQLDRLRREVAEISARLEGYLGELSHIGCLFKGPQGLVDFYSTHEGRPVYLCWHYGEEEIRFWHELEDGFAGRRPLEPDMLTASPAAYEGEG
jgi:hypothetical protein